MVFLSLIMIAGWFYMCSGKKSTCNKMSPNNIILNPALEWRPANLTIISSFTKT